MTTDNLDTLTAAPAQPSSLRERIRSLDGAMTALSAVLLPLGLLVIVLGWYGAAHSPYLYEQVPYLISGGLIGLGLVLTGGLVYFGSWIARGALQQKQASDELAGLLREIRDQLHERPIVAALATAPSARKPAAARNGHSPFVATAKGSMLHRPDCSIVAGRADLREIPAAGSGLAPCALCDPFALTTVS